MHVDDRRRDMEGHTACWLIRLDIDPSPETFRSFYHCDDVENHIYSPRRLSLPLRIHGERD
jgi:hypothetical protein